MYLLGRVRRFLIVDQHIPPRHQQHHQVEAAAAAAAAAEEELHRHAHHRRDQRNKNSSTGETDRSGTRTLTPLLITERQ